MLVGFVLNLQVRQSAIAVLETGANTNTPSVQNGVTLREVGLLKDALGFLHATDNVVDRSACVSLPQGCVKLKALSGGKIFHAQMHQRGFVGDRFLLNTLITMYATCGSPEDSQRVFDQMTTRDAFSWNAMISAYARHGFSQEALVLFRQMKKQSEIQPDQFTFTGVLPACNTLETLEEVHEAISRRGFQYDVFVGTALLDMYAKFGIIEKACDVFDKMPKQNIVSWNAMITGYLHNGYIDEALKLFREIPQRNVVS